MTVPNDKRLVTFMRLSGSTYFVRSKCIGQKERVRFAMGKVTVFRSTPADFRFLLPAGSTHCSRKRKAESGRHLAENVYVDLPRSACHQWLLTTVALGENGRATLCLYELYLFCLDTLSIAPGDQSSANHERNTKMSNNQIFMYEKSLFLPIFVRLNLASV
jgi:hypothetical protein